MISRGIAWSLSSLVLVSTVLLIPSAAEGAVTLSTTRVSVSSMGAEGNLATLDSVDMTPDGRYVVFASDASTLVSGDTNGCADIFVHDRLLRTTERVSLGASGGQGNGASTSPSISDDGRRVAFVSAATNLITGDSNGVLDVFVRDRLTNTTALVSESTGGALGNADSVSPAISGNGRYVAFESGSQTFVHGDLDVMQDIFVRDLVSAATTCVSVTNGGSQIDDEDCLHPDISADGRYVVFDSTTEQYTYSPGGPQVYRHDRADGTVSFVSASRSGMDCGGGSASISSTGRWIAFASYGSSFVDGDENGMSDIYVRDMSLPYSDAGAFTRISYGEGAVNTNGNSTGARVSPDGRYVAFVSEASNIVGGDTNADADVFVRDRLGVTVRASVSSAAVQGTGPSDGHVGIAEFGQAVAFSSLAPELTAGDTNLARDVFVCSALRTCTVEHDAGAVTFDRWVTGFSDSYSSGGYVYSRWAGTSIETKFSGTQVAWVGPKQPNYGKAEVYLDGVYKTTVDCYAATGTTTALLWTSAVLPDTAHTLRIRLTGTQNPASGGNVVVVDRFLVNSFGTGATAGRYDEQGSHATYSGTWVKSVNPTYVAKSYSYAAWAGPVYTASFFGSKVAWIGPMSTAYGKANVYIDGALKGTVDCYSAATGWRYRIWESASLTRGQHYIQIKPTRTKRAAATNYVVVVDALDVMP